MPSLTSPSIGVDTAPIIYFIDRHPTYVDLVREVFRRIDSGAVRGFTSAITLTEVLTRPRQLGNKLIEAEYRELLLRSRNFWIVPIDASVAEAGAELRARYHLRTPDALQIAAAMIVGCQAFLTNDAALRRRTDIRVHTLDDLLAQAQS